MFNKNIKRLLLFFTLCIILAGIVSATDTNSDSYEVEDSSHQTTYTSNRISEVNDNQTINDNEKTIIKNEKNLKTNTKIKTKASIDYIPTVSVNDGVLISGTLTDINNNPLRDTEIRLDVNGEDYDTQTDYYGEFFGEYFISHPGTYTVTASFTGNNKYGSTNVKRTFTAVGQARTYIELNELKDTTIGKTITISGYYSYGYDIPLKNTNMKINVNGKNYTAKTNNNGYFKYNYKTVKTGTNTVTVSYPGNSKFLGTSAKTTFNVKSTQPQYTYITLNNIANVKKGEYTTISGHYYYGNNKPLQHTTMRIKINGKTYTTQTNNNGYFTYKYKTNKIGTNTATVTYPGNNKFKSATITKTFNVKSNSPNTHNIELSTPKGSPSEKIVGTDAFNAFYTTYYGEDTPGVYVKVYNYGDSTRDWISPYNILTSAKFYFKNSQGKIITRTSTEGTGLYLYHNLISGYTPYKVQATYRKMTSQERWNLLRE